MGSIGQEIVADCYKTQSGNILSGICVPRFRRSSKFEEWGNFGNIIY